tara:strand:- start:1188 stop:1949 length:762 start_codon:yes stop_codon:yes gene_type:complete
MIKGIESNIANDVNQLTTLEKPNDESGTFMDSLNTFKDLLSDLNPFTEEKSNIATPKDVTYVDKITPKLSVFPDKVVDVAEEVSRGVFQSNSTTDQKLTFDLSDISALQKVLADSLKASLLTTNASGTDQHMGINSSNSSLLGTAALNFFESAGEASLSKGGHAIEDAVNVINYVPIATDIYKNTIGTKDKVEQQIDLYSSVSNGLLIGGPAGAAFTIADAVTQEITGSSLFENFFEFSKETFNEFWGDKSPN